MTRAAERNAGAPNRDFIPVDRTAFEAKFEHVFEHSPWVVSRAFESGPFADINALHDAFISAVNKADEHLQLALILAHPELGAKTALTEASDSEQQGAGLKSLTQAEFDAFSIANNSYREKFGFPFIICVRLNTKRSILAAYEVRLTNDAAAERAAAIAEIGKIARLRLDDLAAKEHL